MSDNSDDRNAKTVAGTGGNKAPAGRTLIGVGARVKPGESDAAHDQTLAPVASPNPAPPREAATVITRGPTKRGHAAVAPGNPDNDADDNASSNASSSAKSNDDALIGAELSGYRIERKLAEGGMGVVYVAEHTKIGKRAAVKVLKHEYCQDESVVARFTQEARAVNEIRHENIVEIYDFGP